MAFVGDNQKLLDPNQQSQAQGQAQQINPQSQATQLGGGGDDIVGGGSVSSQPSTSSGAQAGSGGQGGWTNIQEYMNANKADPGSAKMLNDTVGGQFDSEKKQLDTQSSDLTSKAQSQVDKVTQAQSGAANMIENAGKNYAWNGQQNSDYSNGVSNLQHAMNDKYDGPSSYDYGLSDKTQKYGQNLSNDNGFGQYMGDLYQQRAGGQLSGGGRSLQTQLDVSNQPLNDMRQNLLAQYSGLGDYRDQVAKSTNDTLSKSAGQYRDAQTGLKSYFGGQGDSINQAESSAESQARTDYQNALNSASGRSSASWGNSDDPLHGGGLRNAEERAGLYAPDLTWSQLQAEQNAQSNAPSGKKFSDLFANPTNDTERRGQDNFNALNAWYGQQDQKYATTGDPEKAKWNAIQEILGNSDRKSQGFKVRG